jgi:hypothetical protein
MSDGPDRKTDRNARHGLAMCVAEEARSAAFEAEWNLFDEARQIVVRAPLSEDVIDCPKHGEQRAVYVVEVTTGPPGRVLSAENRLFSDGRCAVCARESLLEAL